MKKEYEITYSPEREQWELWEVIKGERFINRKCVFEGMKNECQEKLKELKSQEKVKSNN